MSEKVVKIPRVWLEGLLEHVNKVKAHEGITGTKEDVEREHAEQMCELNRFIGYASSVKGIITPANNERQHKKRD